MKIESNSHAMELIKDLTRQGYLKKSYLTIHLDDYKRRIEVIYKFRGKKKE